jgi:uncharacterized protein YjcR
MTLSSKQCQAALLIGCGRANADVAETVGVSARTVERWRSLPDFAKAEAEARKKMQKSVLDQSARNLNLQVDALSTPAIALVKAYLQDDKAPPNVRLGAARLAGNWAGLQRDSISPELLASFMQSFATQTRDLILNENLSRQQVVNQIKNLLERSIGTRH